MSYSFDVCNEPWIPVIQNGRNVEMGIRDALIQAHEITEIREPVLTAEFGIYRLLIALVMDIYKLRLVVELEDLLETGHFDPSTVDHYLAENASCFNLFDTTNPFLQTAGMDDDDEKPLAGLLPLVPSGTGVVHFHHASEDTFGVSPAAAARLLTAIAPFMTAGGAGLSPSINGAPPWYVLISGESLFHTITLNCCVIPLAKELTGKAPPAWLNHEEVRADARYTSTSLLEALTWRPRRIRLIPGEGGVCSLTGNESRILVSSMKFKPGASCDFSWRDPNVPYRLSGDKDPLPMRPIEERQLWRDTGPLALLKEGTYKSENGKVQFARPTVVDQFEELGREQVIPEDSVLRLTVYGMRTDMKMKVFEWYKERLVVPTPLVVGTPFEDFAQKSMDKADSVGYYLRRAIKSLFPRQGAGNPSALDNLAAATVREFWSSLRPLYEQMLRDMAHTPEKNQETTRKVFAPIWRDHVEKIALQRFEAAAGGLDADADAIQRYVEARSQLRRSVRTALETDEEKKARKSKSSQDSIVHKN